MKKEMRALKFLSGLFFFIAGLQPCLSTNATAQTSAPPAAVNGKMSADEIQWRDPFWPAGFVPPALSPGSVLPATDQPREPEQALTHLLRIGCVVKKGDKFYATINGFTVQTGELVVAVTDNAVYKFIVDEIDFKKVRLRPLKK